MPPMCQVLPEGDDRSPWPERERWPIPPRPEIFPTHTGKLGDNIFYCKHLIGIGLITADSVSRGASLLKIKPHCRDPNRVDGGTHNTPSKYQSVGRAAAAVQVQRDRRHARVAMRQRPDPMKLILDFIVQYPTVTATLALAGGLAIAGAWMSVRARRAERRRRSDSGRR